MSEIGQIYMIMLDFVQHLPCKRATVFINSNMVILPLENVEHCGGEPEQADTGYYASSQSSSSIYHSQGTLTLLNPKLPFSYIILRTAHKR